MRKFGITRVADVTGLDRVGIPVAIAVRPGARSVTVSQGKGIDLDAAKVGALMEAVEVWHAENIDAPLTLASIADVERTGRCCNVRRLPTIGGRVPPYIARLLWIEGHDLVSNQPKLVPFEMVHADYAPPIKPGHGLFPASTNGLASGNHPLEAASRAICELIERDAVAVWHQLPPAQRIATALDISTVKNAACLWACNRIVDAGLRLSAWDVTSDVGVPAMLCLVDDLEARDGHIGLGSGAHPEAGVALLRAVTEAAQTRLTYISGSRDDLDPDEFTSLGHARKRHLAETLHRAGPPSRDHAGIPSFVPTNLKSEVEWLVSRLTERGIDEVITIDLSRGEFGIPVVRCVIPGLEAPHDDPGYTPGPRAQEAAGRSP
jgi:ribosomal protein S12 methylthiotransferase accessory factor